MGEASENPQDTERRKTQGGSSQLGLERGTRGLRHFFGPVVLVAALGAVVILGTLRFRGIPHYPTDTVPVLVVSQPGQDLAALLDYQLKDYKTNLARLDTNIRMQALLIATTVLLIIRRSDSLNLFGNSVPLSWLHFFVPVLMISQWLNFGFILHELIWGRIRGVEIIKAIHSPNMQLQKALFHDSSFIDGWFLTFVDKPVDKDYSGFILHEMIWGRIRGVEIIKAIHSPNMQLQKAIFYDSSFIDGQFLTFVDKPVDKDYSGITHSFTASTAGFLVLVLGMLVSAAHASLLAIVSIGCRRYLPTRSRWRLFCYYALPIVPLMILLTSHVQFAYGGENRNWLQLYIAVVTVPLMGFLLWLSTIMDRASYLDSVQCLRRQHHLIYFGSIERLALWRRHGTTEEVGLRTISLIGDSLSTAFCTGSQLKMLLRVWGVWKRNWFLSLRPENQINRSVVERLSDLGTIVGVQHASPAAKVDDGKRRGLRDHLADTWHFSHQVDEVLAGRFPDLLLLWIGHNNVDWRSQTSSRTHQAFLELAAGFVRRYEIQLRRLLNGALASNKHAVLVVFGLINFESFFQARAEAECRKQVDRGLYPHLETAYRYFISMKPEYREGIIELALLYNQKLDVLCQRLDEELSGTNIRLVYSDAMSVARIASAHLLSPVDAWHPSPYGHSTLADSAYSTVYNQAGFLGWT